jgi:hypothetical protein
MRFDPLPSMGQFAIPRDNSAQMFRRMHDLCIPDALIEVWDCSARSNRIHFPIAGESEFCAPIHPESMRRVELCRSLVVRISATYTIQSETGKTGYCEQSMSWLRT